ncbi:MAG: hypothetical protein QUU85_03760, partial [Candidatus Eisenbacteria bacterium]|nr:hypothetical protein [Candidatus Eisenbacteria bacterium]
MIGRGKLRNVNHRALPAEARNGCRHRTDPATAGLADGISREASPIHSALRYLLAGTGLLALMAAGDPVFGQTQPPAEPAPPPARPAAPSDRFLDRIDFHPSYSSTYTVNRSSRSWDQSLGIYRRVAGLSLTNDWSLNNRRDTSQNDLRGRRGTMNLKLDYAMKGLGGLTVGVDGQFGRQSQLSKYQDQVNNRTSLGLAVASKLPEQMLHRFLAPMAGFGLTTKASFGYDGERNMSRRTAFRDSVKVDGSYRRYEMVLSGNVSKFRTSTTMRRETRAGDSRTRQYDVTSGQRRFELNSPSDDVSQHWESAVDWAPSSTVTGNLTGRWVHDFTQYWDTQAFNSQGAMEGKDGRDKNARMSLSWKPNTGSEFKGEVERGEVSGDYQMQEKDFRKLTTRGQLDAKWKIPEFVKLLAGTDLQATLSSDEAKNRLQETVGFRQVNRKFRGVVRRNLGTKIQLQGSEEITLLQYYYDDRANDRDEKRTVTDASLNYRPSSMWNGIFNVNYGQRQLVNVPGGGGG